MDPIFMDTLLALVSVLDLGGGSGLILTCLQKFEDMKPDIKTEKEPAKDEAAEEIAKDKPQSQRPQHTRASDIIVLTVLATFLLLYILIKDWLLIVINGVLLCLYVLFIRRRLPLPVYGTMDLVEYLNKLS